MKQIEFLWQDINQLRKLNHRTLSKCGKLKYHLLAKKSQYQKLDKQRSITFPQKLIAAWETERQMLHSVNLTRL